MTNLPQVPRHVTRFYGNVDFALDVIANKQITFAHICMLNDPFDPYFDIETDFGGKRDELLNWVRKVHPDDVQRIEQLVTEEFWQRTFQQSSKWLVEKKKTTFVFCTSAETHNIHPTDNLYMWAHYGNGHRGVALEFDTGSVASALMEFTESTKRRPLEVSARIWQQIQYQDSFPQLTTEDYYELLIQRIGLSAQKTGVWKKTRIEEHAKLMGIVKGKVWSRENEWRVVWGDPDTRMRFVRLPIASDSISAIYLGLKLNQSDKDDFIFEAKQNFPSAKIKLARKRQGDFALDFLDFPEAD